MILLWLIIDQLKTEKKCKEKGYTVAVTMEERLRAYCLCILIPIILGLLLANK